MIAGSFELGIKQANSTFTGMLGMLQLKTVDAYLRAQPVYLDEDWVAKSVPVHSESVIAGHPIHGGKGVIYYYNLLNNFNVGLSLFLIFSLSILGVLLLTFLINEITRLLKAKPLRRRAPKLAQRIASAVSSLTVRRRSAIGLFIVSVHLFLWITELFLTNNIKVEV